ncbi:hypothetical protein ACFVIM_11435 [Streptomyces sp. NPDC057638]|uniref:hypothetical protein n=1 Tax=Streptomyces sp. NPDC057638 TaxID=3346190 RepID=UPI0036AFDCBC
MHRHRALCARAFGPLEIAAGLEAHGITDRAAARFRHRDVFSLAEELHARVPREDAPESTPAHPPERGWRWRPRAVALALLPGALAWLTVAGREVVDGTPRTAVTVGGSAAVALAMLLVLRHGPLRAPRHQHRPALWPWTLWLLGYAASGDARLTTHTDALPPLEPVPLAALTLSLAPALWGARLLTTQARRRIDQSTSRADFATRTRSLPLTVTLLYVAGLSALLALADLVLPGSPGLGGHALVSTLSLGALLFLAGLLAAHGRRRVAATCLAAACAAEAVLLALTLTGRVEHVELGGIWALVPAVACAVAAGVLLAHATVTLARASAHTMSRPAPHLRTPDPTPADVITAGRGTSDVRTAGRGATRSRTADLRTTGPRRPDASPAAHRASGVRASRTDDLTSPPTLPLDTCDIPEGERDMTPQPPAPAHQRPGGAR